MNGSIGHYVEVFNLMDSGFKVPDLPPHTFFIFCLLIVFYLLNKYTSFLNLFYSKKINTSIIFLVFLMYFSIYVYGLVSSYRDFSNFKRQIARNAPSVVEGVLTKIKSSIGSNGDEFVNVGGKPFYLDSYSKKILGQVEAKNNSGGIVQRVRITSLNEKVLKLEIWQNQ